MKIKRLELMGFKSFPDKTVLHFQEGITGVVGPNGCGKSNIVDAIRWVMGEMSAKHLRGKSMEDVIFSGTTQRNPMGMASVTMVFSTEDGRVPSAYAHFSEVAINRRLYRSGESEYYINQTQCRLRDIHDLFLGTGVGVRAYSIIEQGRIGQVISAKPEERRLILEEAAGISKFKNRKEAALRKIEATRANLLRLSDIISELKRQINSLDRQARKAERYQILYKELKEIELHLNSLDYLLHRRNDENLSQEVSHLQDQETQISVQVESSENKLAEIRLALQEKEAEYMTRQHQLYEKNN
ncbi:MAG: AAA family ATPase [Deltaproteobacteria bacterium]|nr:AAA family ATPase [Deltaproteobacteria bacterium]